MKKLEELLKQMMEQMNKQFEKIDKRFDKVDQQFDVVNKRIDSLKETVENNALEFRSHFRHIEAKLDEHDKLFEIIADEMKFDLKHHRKK